MHVPITLATLALAVSLIVLLRLHWPGLQYKTRARLISLGIAATLFPALLFLARLSTPWDQVNAALYWVFVLGYVFFMLLFTLLRPRWLTTAIAVTLLLPLLSTSTFLPLCILFSHQSHRVHQLGDNLISDLTPIDAVTAGASGADFTIYRRFPRLPFLQRHYMGSRYFNTQCNTSAAYAILQPDHRRVLMACPALPGMPPDAGRSIVLNLYPH